MRKESANPAELLQRAGLRRTPVRQGVLEILSAAPQPLSAVQVQEKFSAAVDRVTLYRTLHTLVQKKLLHRARGDDQVWRYGIVAAQGSRRHEHAHFVCDECGTVECLSEAPIPARRSRLRRGYRVDYSEVLVHGACPDCRR